MENPYNSDCKFCNILTSDRCSQLSTSSYKLKKEKREAKKRDIATTPSKGTLDTLNPSLVDLACMSVIGTVNGQGMLHSPGLSDLSKKKKKVEKEKATTTKAKLSTEKPAKSVSDSRSAKASTDAKIVELDQKWSDHFNKLEALLIPSTLDRELTFQTVEVAPTHSPPADIVRSTNPFIKPANRPATQSTPSSSDLPGTDSSAAKHQSQQISC